MEIHIHHDLADSANKWEVYRGYGVISHYDYLLTRDNRLLLLN